MAHNGKLIQGNRGWLYFGGGYEYIDRCLDSNAFRQVDNSEDYHPENHDENGYMHTLYNGGVYKAMYIPRQTDRPGNYKIDWIGAAPANAVKVSTTHVVVSGAFTGTNGSVVITPDTSSSNQVIIRMEAVGSPYITKLRMYHVDDEALLNAGEIFSPRILSFYEELGVIRHLDPQNNNTASVVRWADRITPTHHSYTCDAYPIDLYAGLTTNSGDDYSITPPVGYVRSDKSQMLVKFNATSTGLAPTIDDGGGALPIRDFIGNPIITSRKPVANRIACLTYDALLECYLKHGGDAAYGNYGIRSGEPIEISTALCNKVGAHSWTLTPYLATESDWTAEQTDYKRNNLSSGLKDLAEPPNENWNTSGGYLSTGYSWNAESVRASTVWRGLTWVTATSYSIGDGLMHNSGAYICTANHTSGSTTEPGVGASWATRWVLSADNANWYGRAASKIFKAVKTAYSGDTTRYSTIIGVKLFSTTANNADKFNASRYLAEPGVDPNDAPKLLATHLTFATYVQPGWYNTATETTMATEWASATDARKAELEDEYITHETTETNVQAWEGVKTWIETWVTYAGTLSLGAYEYEGGLETNQAGGSGTVPNFRNAAKYSPRTRRLTQLHKRYFMSLGGEFPSHYYITGAATWGLADDSYGTVSPQWEGYKDINYGRYTFLLEAS